MPHAITENAANSDHSTAPSLPNNGETGTWWGVYEAFFQQLADRCQALFMGSISGDGAASKKLAINLQHIENSSDRFSSVVSSDHYHYQQTDVTSVGALWFSLAPLPVGAKLVALHVRLKGSSGHAALPATMPKATVVEQTDETDTEIANASDTSANTTAYQAYHTLSVTLNATIGELKNYYVKIQGEGSTNSQVGLNVTGIFVELGPA